MVIDLKVLVKSFNCEDRSCYSGNPRESFFASSRKIFLFTKISRKLDIMNHYHCIHYSLLRATTSCRPGVRQENGTAHFPFILVGGSQASGHSQIPWSWITSLHLPLVLPNVAPNAAAKLPKVRLARAKHQCPRCLLFLWCPPLLMAWGLRKLRERVGESQSAFWREWPSKPCKKIA